MIEERDDYRTVLSEVKEDLAAQVLLTKNVFFLKPFQITYIYTLIFLIF
jgi:hypothetical protein